MRTFQELLDLYDTDVDAFQAELRTMRDTSPQAFEAFQLFAVGRARMATEDDRPLTLAEVEGLVLCLMHATGWPRTRVLAEALLRLQATLQEGEGRLTFKATRSGPYELALPLAEDPKVPPLPVPEIVEEEGPPRPRPRWDSLRWSEPSPDSGPVSVPTHPPPSPPPFKKARLRPEDLESWTRRRRDE